MWRDSQNRVVVCVKNIEVSTSHSMSIDEIIPYHPISEYYMTLYCTVPKDSGESIWNSVPAVHEHSYTFFMKKSHFFRWRSRKPTAGARKSSASHETVLYEYYFAWASCDFLKSSTISSHIQEWSISRWKRTHIFHALLVPKRTILQGFHDFSQLWHFSSLNRDLTGVCECVHCYAHNFQVVSSYCCSSLLVFRQFGFFLKWDVSCKCHFGPCEELWRVFRFNFFSSDAYLSRYDEQIIIG